jgi:hypothetical protein
MDHNLSHAQITYTCVGMNILFVALAYFFRDFGTTWLILTMVTLACAITGAAYYTRRKKAGVSDQIPLEEATLTSRILQLRKKGFIESEQN